MNPADATALIAAHDQTARDLSRTRKGELEAIDRDELTERGIERIFGTMSKDELIADIMRYRFPSAQMNEARHVKYHKPGEKWDICEFCIAATLPVVPDDAEWTGASSPYSLTGCQLCRRVGHPIDEPCLP